MYRFNGTWNGGMWANDPVPSLLVTHARTLSHADLVCTGGYGNLECIDENVFSINFFCNAPGIGDMFTQQTEIFTYTVSLHI